MTPHGIRGYCPECREFTVIDPGRPCAWCGATVERRKGGWKRPDRRTFSPVEVEAIATAHANGASLRAIARAIRAKRPGHWSSEGSALETIRTALKRDGYAVRAQGAATAAANRARPNKRLPGEDRSAYKRRVRRERGYRDSRTGEHRIATRHDYCAEV